MNGVLGNIISLSKRARPRSPHSRNSKRNCAETGGGPYVPTSNGAPKKCYVVGPKGEPLVRGVNFQAHLMMVWNVIRMQQFLVHLPQVASGNTPYRGCCPMPLEEGGPRTAACEYRQVQVPMTMPTGLCMRGAAMALATPLLQHVPRKAAKGVGHFWKLLGGRHVVKGAVDVQQQHEKMQ